MLSHDLKWTGKTAAATALSARFGTQVKPPDSDERTHFWISTYNLAKRSRPHTNGIPMQLDPLKVIELVNAMELPASPEEAIVVVCAMDDAWLEWKDSRQQAPKPRDKSA